MAALWGCQPALAGPKDFKIEAISRAPDQVVIQDSLKFYHYVFPGKKAAEYCPTLNPQLSALTPPWPAMDYERTRDAWVSRNPGGDKLKGQVSVAICVDGDLTPTGDFVLGTQEKGVTLLIVENL